MRATAAVTATLSLATLLGAQTEDFGKSYSFDERKPRTQVERTIDSLLPSLVKIHGASGLKTISAYATVRAFSAISAVSAIRAFRAFSAIRAIRAIDDTGPTELRAPQFITRGPTSRRVVATRK